MDAFDTDTFYMKIAIQEAQRAAEFGEVPCGAVIVLDDQIIGKAFKYKKDGADVIDIGALNGARVKFGATVNLIDEDTEAEMTYQIVGEYEASVEEGKISIASPIARALISKEIGDSVEVNTPGGAKSYEILDVKFV